jgi:hypothetical protein
MATIQEQINGINEYVKQYGTVKIDYRPTARKDDGGGPRYVYISTEEPMKYRPETANDYEMGLVFGAAGGERVAFGFSGAAIEKIHREMYAQPLGTPRWTPTDFFKMPEPEEYATYNRAHNI